MREGVWVDAGWRDGTGGRIVKVKAFSEAWFTVLQLVPDLREALALGDRVTVAGRGVVLQTGPDGAEQLGDADRAALRVGW